MINRNTDSNTDKSETNDLSVVRVPEFKDAVNNVLTKIFRRQVSGRPISITALTTFERWHLLVLIQAGFVAENADGQLTVIQDELAKYIQLRTVSGNA
jgi:hypothetical protein